MEDVYSSQRKSIDAEDPADLPLYARPANVYRNDLGAGVSCMVPTALYADEKGTLPHKDRQEPDAAPTSSSETDLRSQRLAAVMIAWNIFEHFYPYFDVVAVDWSKQLEIALSSAATDADSHDFYQTLFRMIVALQDGHGTLSGPGMNAEATLPLQVELIEGKIVVVKVTDGAGDVQPGDIVERIDGVAAMEEFEKRAQRSADSTPQGRNYKAAFFFGWGGHNSQAVMEVRGADDKVRTVTVARCSTLPAFDTGRPAKLLEIRPGIFYVDLTRISMEEIDEAMEKLVKADGLVFDLRGYPTDKIPALLSHLSPQPLQSAIWNIPITRRPDHTDVEWDTSGRWTLQPLEPQLTSNRVFLTDGSAISFSETVMGIVEAYKLGEIVGQATAGTNGNMCLVKLPLGYQMGFTGMKVLKHDGSQHHGVGILPTVSVNKTIQGVREGRDEQLEEALRLLETGQKSLDKK
jgi:C-terminal processing protease CtpA/Prc